MARYDEASGRFPTETLWGRWWQSLETVELEVESEAKIRGADVRVVLTNTAITVVVAGKEILNGRLWGTVVGKETIWTLEDGRCVAIQLPKASPGPSNVWESLLCADGDAAVFPADPALFNRVTTKLAKEAFHAQLDAGQRSLDHDDDMDDE